jgi:hypothetical protein
MSKKISARERRRRKAAAPGLIVGKPPDTISMEIGVDVDEIWEAVEALERDEASKYPPPPAKGKP